MYALSTLAMHHRALFTGHHQRSDPPFELISETTYDVPSEADDTPERLGRRILRDNGLDGAFSVQGSLESGALTIFRDRPIRSYRLTYDVASESLTIERQSFDLVFALEMLHRRKGFQHPYLANDLWAVVVDVVIVAILLWAVTGLWMWWQMSRTRKLGAACMAAGLALFALFLFML